MMVMTDLSGVLFFIHDKTVEFCLTHRGRNGRGRVLGLDRQIVGFSQTLSARNDCGAGLFRPSILKFTYASTYLDVP